MTKSWGQITIHSIVLLIWPNSAGQPNSGLLSIFMLCV